MHQQRSGLLPVALAFSAAQTLGSPQIGQRVGSMVSIYAFEIYFSVVPTYSNSTHRVCHLK
jgi:hypothetical protein